MDPDAGGEKGPFRGMLPSRLSFAAPRPSREMRKAQLSKKKRKRDQEASTNVADWKLETARFR